MIIQGHNTNNHIMPFVERLRGIKQTGRSFCALCFQLQRQSNHWEIFLKLIWKNLDPIEIKATIIELPKTSRPISKPADEKTNKLLACVASRIVSTSKVLAKEQRRRGENGKETLWYFSRLHGWLLPKTLARAKTVPPAVQALRRWKGRMSTSAVIAVTN